MPGILDLQVPQAPPLFSHSFFHDTLHEQHWHVTWFLGWSACGSPSPPGGTYDLRLRPRFHFRSKDSVYLPYQVSVGEEEGGAGQEWQACPSSGLGCGATLHMLALSSLSRLEAPITLLHYLFLRCRPLTTLGHPPPTAVVESQWGEPRLDAFGTDARVAGSISLGLVLLPLWATCRVGEEEGGTGQGRAGASVAMFGIMDSWVNSMSSPDSFDYGDLELNPEVLSELLVIETTQLASTSIPFTEEPNPGFDSPIASTSSIKNELPPTDPHSDDLFDPPFVLRVTDLEGLDAIEQHYRNAISLPNHSLHLAQSLITSRGDGKSPSPDEPSTSHRGTQHKSSIHSIDH
ncbi:hypothetical protein EDB85DRAFT_1896227 [Lactarius pseudohatsudake]|nr:hypothetical protein EDB85DRAFT_1896227 [Lactarius pseudohatsudake]